MDKIKRIIIKAFIFCTLFHPAVVHAKLPVEYGDFNVNGVNMSLPLAELEIDGQILNKSTSGADPVIINSRTLVPLRALSEKLGYHVTWIESIQKATIEKSGRKIELTIGKSSAKVDGKDVVITDGIFPMIIDSRTYVPIRFVVENMGLNIDYNAQLNKIFLNSQGDISELLFDYATQIEDVDIFAITASNFDPSVPLDVEQFIVKEPTPPTSPSVPTPPVVSSPSSVKTQDDKEDKDKTQLKEEAKYEVSSNLSKTGAETFTIGQTEGEIDMNYFFLSSPKRLVIDIKDVKPTAYEIGRQLSGNTFLSVSSKYHSDGNYTRFTLTLDENVDNSEIKVEKEKNIIRIVKTETIKQGEEFKYNFDKKTGTLDIRTTKNIEIANTSSDDKTLEIVLPKDAITLNKGNLNVSNRIVSSIVISEKADDYVITVKLQDRVDYTISKTNNTSRRITFNKKDRDIPLIVLDPGHGGKDAGAVNKEFNINEKTLNMQIANKLKTKLEKSGYKVVMSRYDDTFVPLNDIANFSNSQDPDIFISIHHNAAASNTSANGIETYYTDSQDSKALANIIQKELISYSKATDRGVKTMPFVVIKKNNSPAVLLELGFMTNRAEIQKNMSDSYQETLTDALTSAVNKYFNR